MVPSEWSSRYHVMCQERGLILGGDVIANCVGVCIVYYVYYVCVGRVSK